MRSTSADAGSPSLDASAIPLPRRPGVVRASGNGWTRSLGAASAALGVPALTLAGAVCRIAGLPDDRGERTILRVVGARELAVALGLLVRPHRAWLWARVAGDAIDLTMLAGALSGHRGPDRRRTRILTSAVAAIAAFDLAAALTSTETRSTVELVASVTVRRPRTEVYDLWRGLRDLPRFMAHVDEVQVVDDRHSHWEVSAPFGRPVQWDAEIVEDVHGERLRWRSTEGASVPSEGTVLFADAPRSRGTEVHVHLRYEPPAGDLGRALARYFGQAPRQQLDDDLRRLKQLLETGEVVRSDGAPDGTRARHQFPQRAARPISASELSEEADA